MTDVLIKSEPLTYNPDGHSFFRDLLFAEIHGDAKAEARLSRHAAEMRVIEGEREKRALSELRAGGIEYRVEPNRTPGTGGDFSPPLWVTALFATAKRPAACISALIPARFDLPAVSSVNLPVLTTGTKVRHVVDNTAPVDQPIVDAAGTSTVVTLASQADAPLQMLEQSPAGASLDWALFRDMGEAADYDLESQLISGHGSTYSELVGLTNVTGITSLTYTSASPTGSGMYPFVGQGAAQLADARFARPEIICMRHARFQWLTSAEDTAGRPFGLPTPWYFGAGSSATPDPISGMNGLPIYGNEAIQATLGTTANQDQILLLRPSDLIFFSAPPVMNVYREVLSGNLGARIQFHQRVASIQTRYPSGIATIGGSGFVVASGY